LTQINCAHTSWVSTKFDASANNILCPLSS